MGASSRFNKSNDDRLWFLVYCLLVPTFPKRGRLLTPRSPESDRRTSVYAPSGVCNRAGCGNWAGQTAKPPCSGPAVVFFSAAGRPVLPLSFSLDVDRSHAHDGDPRRLAHGMAGLAHGAVTAVDRGRRGAWSVRSARCCRRGRSMPSRPVTRSICTGTPGVIAASGARGSPARRGWRCEGVTPFAAGGPSGTGRPACGLC